jgi:hypothetical protein
MSPWLILVTLVAAINLAAFTALRGRWDRQLPVLALASLIGTAIGSGIGQRTGLELLRIGDLGVLSGSVVAQLAMLVSSLMAHILPSRSARNVDPARDPARDPGRGSRDGSVEDR